MLENVLILSDLSVSFVGLCLIYIILLNFVINVFFGITGFFVIFLGHKVLKNNIWMKNYIGEEILDGCD